MRNDHQVWAVQMEAYLDANDLWEAEEEVYEVPPLMNYLIPNAQGEEQRQSDAKSSLFMAMSATVFTSIMTHCYLPCTRRTHRLVNISLEGPLKNRVKRGFTH